MKSFLNWKWLITSSESPSFEKSQSIPSDNAEALVVTSPVNFIAIKSPGNISLSAFAYTCGSFSFTHASLDAVKFPGEFSRQDKHFSPPIDWNAFSPYDTALL